MESMQHLRLFSNSLLRRTLINLRRYGSRYVTSVCLISVISVVVLAMDLTHAPFPDIHLLTASDHGWQLQQHEGSALLQLRISATLCVSKIKTLIVGEEDGILETMKQTGHVEIARRRSSHPRLTWLVPGIQTKSVLFKLFPWQI